MTAPAITTPTDAFLSFAPGTPLKEHAWAMYCQGAHSPEIGRTLGVPERTIRHWLNRTLNDLDAEHQDMRQYQLSLAIARKRQLATAAWDSYHRLTAIADGECAKAADGDPTANMRLARQALASAARYLALANTIDRDLVRLSDVGHSGRSEPRQRSASPLPFREGGQGVETRERRSGARSDGGRASPVKDEESGESPTQRPQPGKARAARSGSAPKVRLEATADHHDQHNHPITHTADHRDDPPDAADLLDLITPDILARMAADGLLDDWPPSLASDTDDDSPESENAATSAKSAKSANHPENTALAAAAGTEMQAGHPTSAAHTPQATQSETAATTATTAMPPANLAGNTRCPATTATWRYDSCKEGSSSACLPWKDSRGRVLQAM